MMPLPPTKTARSLAEKELQAQLINDACTTFREQGPEAASSLLSATLKSSRLSLELDTLLMLVAKREAKKFPAGALALVNEVVKRNPEGIDALLVQAALLDRLGQRKAAKNSALRILDNTRAKPSQIISACLLLGQLDETDLDALAAAKRAYLALDRPLKLASVLLLIGLKYADWPLVEELTAQLRAAQATGLHNEARETPRTHLLWCDDEKTNIAVIKAWSERSLRTIEQQYSTRPLIPAEGRRLRIGYLSSDFREHPTSYLVQGLFRWHDKSRFEVFMYCSGWDDGSKIRASVLSHADHVRTIANLSDAEAARLIQSDAIDVLVELNGPTHAHRMGVLAYRPAPVQIDYLGWPGSVGGRFLDYIVGDEYTIPFGQESLYPEKVIRLDGVYQINDYAAKTLPVAPQRAALSLPENAPVLGMFNAINKVRDEVWSTWMEILKAVPEAVFWLLDPGPMARANIVDATRACGVAPERILIAPRAPQNEHLARLQCCDLMLDPWPYGGHTTTSDALFAGVPVVTLAGQNFAGRVSGALLKLAGLESLIQPDTERYISTAVRLISNKKELTRLKQFVRERVPLSPVFDARLRTQQLESAYCFAFDLKQKGRPAGHLNLKPAPVKPFHPNHRTSAAEKPKGATVQITGEQRIPLVLICGPWSSGTSAVAGLLANAGLVTPGPYVKVNDPRTPATFEMKALKNLLNKMASEATLKRVVDANAALSMLKTFRDDNLAPLWNKNKQPLVLKHALTALFLPQFCELFDVRIVSVIRSLEDIEQTRQRRKWAATFGRAGAELIYREIFGHMVETMTPYYHLRYNEMLGQPTLALEKLLDFCGIECSEAHKQAALAFIRQPTPDRAGIFESPRNA